MIQYFDVTSERDFPVCRWQKMPSKKSAERAIQAIRKNNIKLCIGVSSSLVNKIVRIHEHYITSFGGTPVDDHAVHYVAEKIGYNEALVRVVLRGVKK